MQSTSSKVQTTSTQVIWIVGASVRAACESARRSGLVARGFDQFCDRDSDPDTVQFSNFHRLANVARRAIQDSSPPTAWMFTGGMENYPDVVSALSRYVPLLGCSASVLRVVRDPQTVYRVLTGSGLQAAEIADRIPELGEWLVKPLKSAAGRGIRFWTPEARFNNSTHYLQRFVSGQPVSAAFLAGDEQLMLLGVMESFHDELARDQDRFRYDGSIGPIKVSPSERETWNRIGTVLRTQFGVRGLFGVDAIRGEDGIEVVEVNPRLTASMELLDRARGGSVVAQHVQACLSGLIQQTPNSPSSAIWGKAICYAHSRRTISAGLSDVWWTQRQRTPWAGIADIPRPETVVDQGDPICTVFAPGESVEQVRIQLRDRICEIRRQVGEGQHP